ncbi:MAG: type II toxin-antitoxin system Phd/YefM family antitoxin [Oscillospiraceae bacterium]|nr:type II toxin-antitoxin system Phd/YefM family antitoxin [Oscillospiraceae bacterium]
MKIDTNALVSMTEANQNFSKVARLVDQYGSVVILKNNTPRYLVVEFQAADTLQEADSEEVDEISKRLLERNAAAYEELAK